MEHIGLSEGMHGKPDELDEDSKKYLARIKDIAEKEGYFIHRTFFSGPLKVVIIGDYNTTNIYGLLDKLLTKEDVLLTDEGDSAEGEVRAEKLKKYEGKVKELAYSDLTSKELLKIAEKYGSANIPEEGHRRHIAHVIQQKLSACSGRIYSRVEYERALILKPVLVDSEVNGLEFKEKCQPRDLIASLEKEKISYVVLLPSYNGCYGQVEYQKRIKETAKQKVHLENLV